MDGKGEAMRRWLTWALCFALLPLTASSHIGNPNFIYEGSAGPYPVRVIIRTPGVVPGLADIHVRVLTNSVRQVSVLPVHWRDRKSTRLNSSHLPTSRMPSSA